jgi:ABC-type Na+ efflux pump permease subunit
VRAVLRREWLRYRSAMGRTGLLRFILIYGVVFGLFVPAQIDNPSAAFLVFALIPLYVSGPAAVDGFAGERERNTFETLVSSPVRPGQLVAGKLLFASVLGTSVSLAVMILFSAWRLLKDAPIPPPAIVPVVVVLGVILSLLGSAVGLNVSVRAKSVRSAMQWFSVVLLVVALGIPVSLSYLVPRLPAGVFDVLGSLFRNGWYSAGTLLLIAFTALVTAVLCMVLRKRAANLWFLNTKP